MYIENNIYTYEYAIQKQNESQYESFRSLHRQ